MGVEAATTGLAIDLPPGRESGLWRDAFRRLLRNRLAVAGLIMLLSIIALAVGAGAIDEIARYDPDFQTHADIHEGPSTAHFFGTDNLGRDTWSRVLAGVRISLQIGLGTQVIVLALGLVVGALAAMGGRLSDNVLMRFTDIMYAFPDLLFIILMRAVLEGRDWLVLSDQRLQIMLAIGLVNWTTIARLVRGQMLALQGQDFVLAARALGARPWRIVLVHMLPNTLGPVVVAVTFGIPIAIFAEAALGFIGFSLPPPTASLGRLAKDGYNFVQLNPWFVVFPASAIALLMLCFTFLGDGLRDALDPRSR